MTHYRLGKPRLTNYAVQQSYLEADITPLYSTVYSIRYTAVKTLDPSDGEAWRSFMAFSGLTHLREVVSLDPMLCPSVHPQDFQQEVDYVVWEDFTADQYHDRAYLEAQVAHLDQTRYSFLAVAKEPTEPAEARAIPGFAFVGYDLLDKHGSASALLNCGGFPETFSPGDINTVGLLSTHAQATRIRQTLRVNNPDEHHADCDIWALWRRI